MPFPRPSRRGYVDSRGHHHDPSSQISGPDSTLDSVHSQHSSLRTRVYGVPIWSLGNALSMARLETVSSRPWSQVRPFAHVARQSSGDAGVGSSWPAREIAQRRRGDPAVHVASRPGLWLVAWSCRRPMHKIHFLLLATKGGGWPPTGCRDRGSAPPGVSIPLEEGFEKPSRSCRSERPAFRGIHLSCQEISSSGAWDNAPLSSLALLGGPSMSMDLITAEGEKNPQTLTTNPQGQSVTQGPK